MLWITPWSWASWWGLWTVAPLPGELLKKFKYFSQQLCWSNNSPCGTFVKCLLPSQACCRPLGFSHPGLESASPLHMFLVYARIPWIVFLYLVAVRCVHSVTEIFTVWISLLHLQLFVQSTSVTHLLTCFKVCLSAPTLAIKFLEGKAGCFVHHCISKCLNIDKGKTQ